MITYIGKLNNYTHKPVILKTNILFYRTGKDDMISFVLNQLRVVAIQIQTHKNILFIN